MPSDRERMTAWYARHGQVTRELLQANQALTAATREWQTTPAPTLRDRTMLGARDLLEAIDRHLTVLPIGAPTVDGPLREALATLRRGADMLASLPLDEGKATSQVMQAGPILQAGYDGIGRATEAANRLS